LEVIDVKNRKLILFHPANNALKELNGCIAPVTKLVDWIRSAISTGIYQVEKLGLSCFR
jgi:hypothetical protein